MLVKPIPQPAASLRTRTTSVNGLSDWWRFAANLGGEGIHVFLSLLDLEIFVCTFNLSEDSCFKHVQNLDQRLKRRDS